MYKLVSKHKETCISYVKEKVGVVQKLVEGVRCYFCDATPDPKKKIGVEEAHFLNELMHKLLMILDIPSELRKLSDKDFNVVYLNGHDHSADHVMLTSSHKPKEPGGGRNTVHFITIGSASHDSNGVGGMEVNTQGLKHWSLSNSGSSSSPNPNGEMYAKLGLNLTVHGPSDEELEFLGRSLAYVGSTEVLRGGAKSDPWRLFGERLACENGRKSARKDMKPEGWVLDPGFWPRKRGQFENLETMVSVTRRASSARGTGFHGAYVSVKDAFYAAESTDPGPLLDESATYGTLAIDLLRITNAGGHNLIGRLNISDVPDGGVIWDGKS